MPYMSSKASISALISPASTTAALSEVKETSKQVVVRRITMLGQQLAREGKILSRAQLLNLSSANKYWRRPAVQEAVQLVHDELMLGSTHMKQGGSGDDLHL